jgi:beta-galactosidase
MPVRRTSPVRAAPAIALVLMAAHCAGSAKQAVPEHAAPRPPVPPPPAVDRERASFDRDWRFFLGDPMGVVRPDFDDSAWRLLDVPHDWAIEGDFDPRFDPHTGGLDVAGVGWYRKHFKLTPGDRRVAIEFDGVMANAHVFLNGHELGSRPYGYIGFGFDLTPYLNRGQGDNVLAVRVAPEDKASRWYPGAGIYRHVWLDQTSDVHVARWGTFVRATRAAEELATVAVRTEIVNERESPVDVTVENVIVDASDRAIDAESTTRRVLPGATDAAETSADIARPHRWDVGDPYRYAVVTTVSEGVRVVDRVRTPFGIRDLKFDPAKGLSLNGRPLKFQGVCMHHDLGALGAAVSARAIERRLQLLKAMGANAIRTSHNPPAPELLDASDRLGLLVMDEAFDQWRKPKTKNGHGKYFDTWAERDLRDMIRRDRNHPSIALYSIGNEVLEQADPEGAGIAHQLTQVCHEEDPTRPVTAAFNQAEYAIRNGLAGEVDVPGFNYQARGYDKIAGEHPEWAIVGSETSSTVSSRGVYHFPIERYEKHSSHEITSYDVVGPRWAYPPDVEFDAQEKFPSVLGEFVWTGFDYLGEPTPYFWQRGGPQAAPEDWPARSSYFGIIDLAGFPKDRYFLYQSVWTHEPMVHVLPHWTWPGREGQPTPVMVYTNAEEAELSLDGKSLGRQRRGAQPVALPLAPPPVKGTSGATFASKYRMLWQVPYAPGTLRAVAFNGGQPVASAEVRTAGPPARVRVAADRNEIHADGDDLAFLTVRVEDKDGNLCPQAGNLVRFQIEGPGRIAAVDNGDPATVERFVASERHAFGGLALVIVRPNRGQTGALRVVSTSEGLEGAETQLTTVP